MHRKAHVYRHIAVPFTFALLLLLLFVPSAFAASAQHGHSAKLALPCLARKSITWRWETRLPLASNRT